MESHFFATCKRQGILFYLLPIAVLCFWLYIYRYHMLNQELFTLFLFSPDFFFDHLSKAGGIPDYTGLFFIQFFRYPLLGALFQTLGFVAVYFFTARIMKRLGLLEGWTGIFYLPALTLLGLQMQYEFVFTETLKVVAYFALFYGYIRIESPKIRMILSIAGAPLLFMLLGGGIFIQIYVIFLLYELCYADKHVPYPAVLSWLVLVPLLPLLYKQFHLVSNVDLYSLFPKIREINFLELIPLLFIWLPGILTIGWCLKKFYKGKFSFRKRNIVIVNLLIVVAFAWILKEKCYYPKVEQLFHVDNATMHEDWDEVLRVAKDYDGTRNAFLVFTNLALAQKGLLTENLLDYPQIGIDGLVHPWQNNYFDYLYGHETLYHLGQMNGALRWIFEASVCKASNVPPRVTQRIIEILIRIEKYEAARKYLYQLLQTWHYKDWALKTLQTLPKSAIISPPTAEKDFLIGTMGPFEDLISMSENSPLNPMIRDYLLTGFLLEKQVPEFYEYFCKYFPAGNTAPLPKLYEEALIIVFQKGIDKNVLKTYNITKACVEKFESYSRDAQTYGMGKPDTPKQLKPKFGNTYWYYYHFTAIIVDASTAGSN